ncbi:MAG: cobaltochelatase subunit CobN [Actinomycetota bacterium]|nr:cobaltochelatase subunit CobN [Actinomycetota bacterium]
MIIFISNADTDLLALRTIVEGLEGGLADTRAATAAAGDPVPDLGTAKVVLLRLLGGVKAWSEQVSSLVAEVDRRGLALWAFSGDTVFDEEMAALSTVALQDVSVAFDYLRHGGLENLKALLYYIGNVSLGMQLPLSLPVVVPEVGTLVRHPHRPGRPSAAVVFYRSHLLSGNLRFIDELCDGLEEAGVNATAVYANSLRPDATGNSGALRVLGELAPDVVITTVLAMGSMGEEGWDASALAALGVPVVQGLISTVSHRQWEQSDAGLRPIDVAMSVALPEFDGRIIGVPFAFKETIEDAESLGAPITAYRGRPDRIARLAGIARGYGRLRHLQNGDKRVAIILSAYPTKRSRLGNAVGLDTPASAIALLHAMDEAGYRVEGIPEDGDALMGMLADRLTYESPELSASQRAAAVGFLDEEQYLRSFTALPEAMRDAMEEAWGAAPGTAYLSDHKLYFSGIALGNVLVAIQPPRGFGEHPIAIYHSPDLPPTHHYLAFYRWLEESWGADALIHLGKHGTLEWLPGKGVGLSAACYPDAVLGDMPLLYPFVVNDPGEGTQAKRRAHATIIDHLLPPMTRAETYDDLAELEIALDQYARIAALDPQKLDAVRREVWEVVVRSKVDQDLGVAHQPTPEEFDRLILEVDGYLCELKDAQIRGGLHVLGAPPQGESLLDMVLSITRVEQGSVPPLRALAEADERDRAAVDRAEAEARARLAELANRRWHYEGDDPTLAWVARRLHPALEATTRELSSTLDGLDGGFVPPGPSGAPTRGMAQALPTGRNFYSIDPKAVPSPLACQVGEQLARGVIERFLAESGEYPRSVGIVVWGTATMRTMGDDIGQALAFLGVRPRWQDGSMRVIGLELIDEEELGRPRVDVTLRISGFFRDAFPHVITLVDQAARLAGFGDTPRIFGAMPGAYGSGVLPLLERGEWESPDEIAEVYTTWSGWAYGEHLFGEAATGAFRTRFREIQIAIKNQDNREHDIFDSDDYLQDHGGMIATVRALSGTAPKAYFGDSSRPAAPKVRDLSEEAARVVRTRVINPKWISAMQRHGYKGAFEMAATVDYLFGYDATAGIVSDWMYERVAQAYVFDEVVQKFFADSNPWAYGAICDRLMEAERRGMWNAEPGTLERLQQARLQSEAWEESR